MEVVAIIQARMGSTRLPGKVLKDVGGKTVLGRVVMRTRRSTLLNEVVVATSTQKVDDLIIRNASASPLLFSAAPRRMSWIATIARQKNSPLMLSCV